MQFANNLLHLFYSNFLMGSFMSVLVIILARRVFKGKVETQNAIVIIKWLLIAYAFFQVVFWLVEFVYNYFSQVEHIQYAILERATGPYAWAYWFMCICNIILPFTLLVKRLGRNVFYLLLVTLLMNFGWLMEAYAIHTTSIERDYVVDNRAYFPSYHEIIILSQGVIVGIITLLIGHFVNKRRLLTSKNN
jgi:hypothetical protein